MIELTFLDTVAWFSSSVAMWSVRGDRVECKAIQCNLLELKCETKHKKRGGGLGFGGSGFRT